MVQLNIDQAHEERQKREYATSTGECVLYNW